MASVASSSATMDLTAVLPALMEGIAQEVGSGYGSPQGEMHRFSSRITQARLS